MTWFLNGYPIHTTGRHAAPRCLDLIEVGPRAATALWQNDRSETGAERLARSIADDRAQRGIG